MDSDASFKGFNPDEAEVPPKLRWSIENRLQFIEFRLYWEGRVNRSDLVRRFGVSTPQASMDLARYQERAGGNIVYDKVAKTYVATDQFKPVLFEPSADQLLAQLRSLAAHGLERDRLWLSEVPHFDAVPLLRRRVDSAVLRAILRAIRSRLAAEIEYQSVSAGGPKWRWISPHAIVFDGFRWHTRAWCHEHREFRDFVLARVLRCGRVSKEKAEVHADLAWTHRVTLRIGPNPRLPPEVRKAIELDYGMTGGVLEVTTRIALSIYAERLHGLDLDPDTVSENRQQLVLLNREAVKAARQCPSAGSS